MLEKAAQVLLLADEDLITRTAVVVPFSDPRWTLQGFSTVLIPLEAVGLAVLPVPDEDKLNLIQKQVLDTISSIKFVVLFELYLVHYHVETHDNIW